MSSSNEITQEITQLLIAHRNGQPDALNRLLKVVYEQLRAMASKRLGPKGTDATLNATALVHEAYIKLVHANLDVRDRQHFFAVSAWAMRSVIIDQVRARLSEKRGGGLRRVDLDATNLAIEEQGEELLALDEALTNLKRIDPRLAEVVELKFFGGFTMKEIAEARGVHERTIDRDWRAARALLYQELRGTPV